MADGPLIFILQFAADVKAEIVGKPSETFFSSVLEDMGVSPENVRQTWFMMVLTYPQCCLIVIRMDAINEQKKKYNQ